MDQERYLTLTDAAAATSGALSPDELLAMLRRGELLGLRVSETQEWRIDRQSLEQLLARRRR